MYPNKGSRWWNDSEEEEESVYSKKGREKLLEEDAMANAEDGVMLGYEEGFDDMFNDEIFDDSFEEVV